MSMQVSADDAVRELMLVLPRLVGRLKRLPPPQPLRSLELTPRHLSLLSMLLLDGPRREHTERRGMICGRPITSSERRGRSATARRHDTGTDRGHAVGERPAADAERVPAAVPAGTALATNPTSSEIVKHRRKAQFRAKRHHGRRHCGWSIGTVPWRGCFRRSPPRRTPLATSLRPRP